MPNKNILNNLNYKHVGNCNSKDESHYNGSTIMCNHNCKKSEHPQLK